MWAQTRPHRMKGRAVAVRLRVDRRGRSRARDLHLSGFVPGIHLRVAGRADAMDLDDRFLGKPPVVVHGRRYPEEVPGDIALALALVDAVAVPEVYTAGDDSDVLVNWVEVRRHLVVRGEPEAVDERTGLARTAVDGRQLDAREGRKVSPLRVVRKRRHWGRSERRRPEHHRYKQEHDRRSSHGHLQGA